MKKNTFPLLFSLFISVFLLITACQSGESPQLQATATSIPVVMTVEDVPVDKAEADEPEPESPELSQDESEETSVEVLPTVMPTPDIRLDPEDWRNWPVVPTISANALTIYEAGLDMGNDPAHFSKVGDCQNVVSLFLAEFDAGRYQLGEEYAYLQETIEYYEGSWERESMAVKGGYNVASVLNPMFSNQEFCEANETPLECEFRIYNPSVVMISMETWWNHDDPTKYEFYMRKVLDEIISYGVLPVLSTKADNLEGDHVINRSIAQLAYEYDIPMWNFWAATDPLPHHGLIHEGQNSDGFHITIGGGYVFDEPENLKYAWPVRNLTALQTMDAVYNAIQTIE